VVNADLVGASLIMADLSRANLSDVEMGRSGQNGRTNLREADLGAADLSTEYLWEGILIEVKYNVHTNWPDDFDPVAAGAVLMDYRPAGSRCIV